MKVGIERVLEVLQEEIGRIDGYCDDFTKDYRAQVNMEKELDKLKEILNFINTQEKPFPKATPRGKEYKAEKPCQGLPGGIPD